MSSWGGKPDPPSVPARPTQKPGWKEPGLRWGCRSGAAGAPPGDGGTAGGTQGTPGPSASSAQLTGWGPAQCPFRPSQTLSPTGPGSALHRRFIGLGLHTEAPGLPQEQGWPVSLELRSRGPGTWSIRTEEMRDWGRGLRRRAWAQSRGGRGSAFSLCLLPAYTGNCIRRRDRFPRRPPPSPLLLRPSPPLPALASPPLSFPRSIRA